MKDTILLELNTIYNPDMMTYHPRKLAHHSTELNHDIGCSRCSVKNPVQTNWKGKPCVKALWLEWKLPVWAYYC